MFNFKKNQKTVFSKLYRYYCAKLLSKLWLVLFYFLLFAVIIIVQGSSFRNLLDTNRNWQWKLGFFWLISFIQLGALTCMMTPLVSYLVGRGLGWEELKKKQLFRMPKISREEDIKVLIYTPDVDRETVIWAKLAAALTYFIAINLILTSLIFIYFLFFTNFGAIASLSFLLLNGVGFALVNFLLVVPFLLYQQEGGSFLVYLLCLIFIIVLTLSVYFSREFIWQYPVIFCLLSIPFSVLVGYSFFSLYRKKSLKNDLD